MFLKAGVLSLALLLVSRVLGLLRESAQAAALGTSGLADVVVLMLTLPDWLASVLLGGALAYVLLPQWAAQPPAAQAREVRRLGLALAVGGSAMALALGLSRTLWGPWLLPGAGPALQWALAQGLWWACLGVPLALLAALWGTRLQHGRDFVGLYAANLLVNLGVIIALIYVANNDHMARGEGSLGVFNVLGGGVTLALAARLGWQRWRLARLPSPQQEGLPSASDADIKPQRPKPAVWLWALVASGLSLVLPFVARSLASAEGEGALSTFNYAWKLVELPLVLAIQLVASVAFPAITQHWAQPAQARQAVRSAYALAWTLACMAVLGLSWAAPAVAQLLLGYGRMSPAALGDVAHLAQQLAWSLLPQAVLAVGLTVLATQQRLRWAALAWALALAGLWTLPMDGGRLAPVFNGVLVLAACVVCVATGGRGPASLPWGLMVGTGLSLALAALGGGAWLSLLRLDTMPSLMLAVAGASLLGFGAMLSSRDLRQALRI